MDKSRIDILVELLHVCWQTTQPMREEVMCKITYGDKESWWLGMELAAQRSPLELDDRCGVAKGRHKAGYELHDQGRGQEPIDTLQRSIDLARRVDLSDTQIFLQYILCTGLNYKPALFNLGLSEVFYAVVSTIFDSEVINLHTRALRESRRRVRTVDHVH
ncbi:hypothetical protein EYZ11_002963 [Aspergillus tanneri]|uniref:Uncharacterized protein n=1 Tax=Aspergillus tanneri TaxID=1220188 RepID=A0A4S3JQ30_9EURO|nr:hypothetical protein EYZ11_002963 [Aspergillus tanneri]